MSIPKGHSCNLDVYKTLLISLTSHVKYYTFIPFRFEFMNISKELGIQPVIGANLAYNLNRES